MLKKNQIEDILKCYNGNFSDCSKCSVVEECTNNDGEFGKELAETSLHYINEFEKTNTKSDKFAWSELSEEDKLMIKLFVENND